MQGTNREVGYVWTSMPSALNLGKHVYSCLVYLLLTGVTQHHIFMEKESSRY